MDAFGVLDELSSNYQAFAERFLSVPDEQVKAKVDAKIAEGLLWPKPWLALNPASEPGGTVSDLVGPSGLARERKDVFHFRDRMAQEIAVCGGGWKPLADPPAGLGPRHSMG